MAFDWFGVAGPVAVEQVVLQRDLVHVLGEDGEAVASDWSGRGSPRRYCWRRRPGSGVDAVLSSSRPIVLKAKSLLITLDGGRSREFAPASLMTRPSMLPMMPSL